jgi:hypothetical protein
MYKITRVPHFLQTKFHIPRLWLPRYLLVALVLVGGFMVPFLGIRVLGKDSTPPDPLVAALDIVSGQSESDLQAGGFLCSSTNPNDVDSTKEWCVMDPPIGMFSTVAALFKNGVRSNVILTLGEDTLSVGDLVRLWGKPLIYQHDSWGQIEWHGNDDMDLTASYKGEYSLFRSVGSIVFMSTGDFVG